MNCPVHWINFLTKITNKFLNTYDNPREGGWIRRCKFRGSPHTYEWLVTFLQRVCELRYCNAKCNFPYTQCYNWDDHKMAKKCKSIFLHKNWNTYASETDHDITTETLTVALNIKLQIVKIVKVKRNLIENAQESRAWSETLGDVVFVCFHFWSHLFVFVRKGFRMNYFAI
jgi:hypothetical protein